MNARLAWVGAALVLVWPAASFEAASGASSLDCAAVPVVEACLPSEAGAGTQARSPEELAPLLPAAAGSAPVPSPVSNTRAGYVSAGAATFLDELGRRLNEAGTAVAAESFVVRYRTVAALGLLLLAPFLLVAAVQAVLRADAGLLLRTLAGRLPVAVVVTVGALALVQLGVTLADEMTRTWLEGPGSAVEPALAELAASTRAAAANTDAFAVTVAAALVAVGAVVVWMELALRSAVLHACLLFLPLALAGAVWPAAAVWARRLAIVIAAVVFAGFFLVVAMSAGFEVTGSVSGPLDGLLLGAGVLLLSGVAPFAAGRLLMSLDTGRALPRRHGDAGARGTLPPVAYVRLLEGAEPRELAPATLGHSPPRNLSIPAVRILADSAPVLGSPEREEPATTEGADPAPEQGEGP